MCLCSDIQTNYFLLTSRGGLRNERARFCKSNFQNWEISVSLIPFWCPLILPLKTIFSLNFRLVFIHKCSCSCSCLCVSWHEMAWFHCPSYLIYDFPVMNAYYVVNISSWQNVVDHRPVTWQENLWYSFVQNSFSFICFSQNVLRRKCKSGKKNYFYHKKWQNI